MMNEDDTPRTDLPLDVPSIHDEEEAVKEDANEEDIAGTGYVPYHPYPGPYPIPPIPPAHWTDEYQVSFAHCVLEFPSRNIFPAVAKKGKLYVAWDTNKIYRWDGNTYVELTGGGGTPVAALASLTLTQGGRSLGVFNPSGSDTSIDIPSPDIPACPTKLSELENDVGYITSMSWDEVSGKPNFATVATTGDYNDLTNKPEIPTVPSDIGAAAVADATLTDMWSFTDGLLEAACAIFDISTDGKRLAFNESPEPEFPEQPDTKNVFGFKLLNADGEQIGSDLGVARRHDLRMEMLGAHERLLAVVPQGGTVATYSGYRLGPVDGPNVDKLLAPAGNYALKSEIPILGTAAALNVPASGDASSEQVVLGSDSRLTDAREPTAHTHSSIENKDSFGTILSADADGTASITYQRPRFINVTYTIPDTEISITVKRHLNDHADGTVVNVTGLENATWDAQTGQIYSDGAYWGKMGNYVVASEVGETDPFKMDGWGMCQNFYLAATGSFTDYVRPNPEHPYGYETSIIATRPKEVTWSELRVLRDNNELVPGQQYRITDYVATTTQEDTQSANHPFDLIVTANSTNQLSEIARAIQHEGDSYFANSNLAAWKVNYCFDNDNSRFSWADGISYIFVNGRKCRRTPERDRVEDTSHPYCWTSVDNNVFSPYYYTHSEMPSVGAKSVWWQNGNEYTITSVHLSERSGGKGVIYRLVDEFGNDCPYDFKGITMKEHESADNVFRYTFDDGAVSGNADASLRRENRVYGNVMGEWVGGNGSRDARSINRNVFKGTSCYQNIFGVGCHDNTFESGCDGNRFGNDCYFNVFATGCYSNSFGSHCSSNTLGNNCNGNAFENMCMGISFGENCSSNVFDSHSGGIYLGNGCDYNMFGSCCQMITFGSFDLQTGERDVKSYYRYNVVKGPNIFLNLNCTSTTSFSTPYRNVVLESHIGNGDNPITITDSNVGQANKTVYQPANTQFISI